MMKMLVSTLFLTTLTIVACQKNEGGGGGGGTVAVTPADCANRGTCADLSLYGPTYAYDTTQDGRGYSNSSGFCGCPVGTRPSTTAQNAYQKNRSSIACLPEAAAPSMRTVSTQVGYTPLVYAWYPAPQLVAGVYAAPWIGVGFYAGASFGWPVAYNLGGPHINRSADPRGPTRNNPIARAAHAGYDPRDSRYGASSYSNGSNRCFHDVVITCDVSLRGRDCGGNGYGGYHQPRCVTHPNLPAAVGVCSAD